MNRNVSGCDVLTAHIECTFFQGFALVATPSPLLRVLLLELRVADPSLAVRSSYNTRQETQPAPRSQVEGDTIHGDVCALSSHQDYDTGP